MEYFTRAFLRTFVLDWVLLANIENYLRHQRDLKNYKYEGFRKYISVCKTSKKNKEYKRALKIETLLVLFHYKIVDDNLIYVLFKF